jgi:hypothetical protein
MEWHSYRSLTQELNVGPFLGNADAPLAPCCTIRLPYIHLESLKQPDRFEREANLFHSWLLER